MSSFAGSQNMNLEASGTFPLLHDLFVGHNEIIQDIIMCMSFSRFLFLLLMHATTSIKNRLGI